MPSAILYSSLGNPKSGFPGYCAATVPDWSGEQSRSWPGRHPEAGSRHGSLAVGPVYQLDGPYRQWILLHLSLSSKVYSGFRTGRLRAERLEDQRHRGLALGQGVKAPRPRHVYKPKARRAKPSAKHNRRCRCCNTATRGVNVPL